MIALVALLFTQRSKHKDDTIAFLKERLVAEESNRAAAEHRATEAERKLEALRGNGGTPKGGGKRKGR